MEHSVELNNKINIFKSYGFTLIELLIAISILTVAFGIVASSTGNLQRSSRDARRIADIKNIQSSLQQYYLDNNAYPLTIQKGAAISKNGQVYLEAVPEDPQKSDNYVYQSLTSTSVACDTENKCIRYCLFAKMENDPSAIITSQCTSFKPSSYNYQATQP